MPKQNRSSPHYELPDINDRFNLTNEELEELFSDDFWKRQSEIRIACERCWDWHPEGEHTNG